MSHAVRPISRAAATHSTLSTRLEYHASMVLLFYCGLGGTVSARPGEHPAQADNADVYAEGKPRQDLNPPGKVCDSMNREQSGENTSDHQIGNGRLPDSKEPGV